MVSLCVWRVLRRTSSFAMCFAQHLVYEIVSLCACCVFFHLVLLEDGLRLGQSEEKFYIDKGKVLEFTENGSGS